jgi:hypothetical protein
MRARPSKPVAPPNPERPLCAQLREGDFLRKLGQSKLVSPAPLTDAHSLPLLRLDSSAPAEKADALLPNVEC